MKPYNTLIEWLSQICDTINQLITRVNGIYSVPPGGNPGQVLTKSGPADHDLAWEDQQAEAANGIPAGGTTGQILAKDSNADYSTHWVDPSGGGVGDVQAGADNTFTGSNTFTKPLTIAEGTAGNHAAQVKQVTELGHEVNTIAGASVTKDGAQTITGVKTFEASPKVPTPVGQADAAPKSYVDTEIDTAAAETLRDAKAYTDGEADRIKDATVTEIKTADNVFSGLNTFAKPVSVGTPVADVDAATKKYVDDIKTGIDGDITQLTDNQTALQEDVQQIQNGVINAMTTTGTTGQVWTKDSGYGKWQDATGGGSGVKSVSITKGNTKSQVTYRFAVYIAGSLLGSTYDDTFRDVDAQRLTISVDGVSSTAYYGRKYILQEGSTASKAIDYQPTTTGVQTVGIDMFSPQGLTDGILWWPTEYFRLTVNYTDSTSTTVDFWQSSVGGTVTFNGTRHQIVSSINLPAGKTVESFSIEHSNIICV